MLANKKVAFIGAGSMAEAIISGILAKNLLHPQQIYVTNRSNKERLQLLQEKYRIETFSNHQEVLPTIDIIILAIKPKDIEEMITKIKSATTNQQLIISVLAGVSTAYISQLLEHDAPVIRTMPNTSAAVGESMTAISAGNFATNQHLAIAERVFKAIGAVAVVAEEKQDAITGVSGSGPAFLYYFIEAMEKGASEVGLDEALAKQLISQVLIGAAERIKTTDLSSETLYKQVMSPNGTAESGIKILESYHFQESIIECIKRATQRSNELGKQYSNQK